MAELTGKKIAFLLTNNYEDSELTSPWEAVTEAGAQAVLVSSATGSITGKKGHESTVDEAVAEADPAGFDALVLPGGVVNADKIRMEEEAVAFARHFFDAGKPVGVICHGAWILTDADVLRGRTLTSYPSLRTDLRNAGATWDQTTAPTSPSPHAPRVLAFQFTTSSATCREWRSRATARSRSRRTS